MSNGPIVADNARLFAFTFLSDREGLFETVSDAFSRGALLVDPNTCWKIVEKPVEKQNNVTTLTIARKPPFSDIRRSGFYGEANSISLSRPYSEVPRLRQLSFPAPNHRLGRTLW